MTAEELHQWAAYFHVKDKHQRIQSDLRCIKLLQGISHIMSSEPDPDFDIRKLFPEVEFTDQEIRPEDMTVEDTIMLMNSSLMAAVPRGGFF